MDLRIFAAARRQSSESNKNRRIDETFKKPSFSPRKFFEIRRMWHTGPELISGCLQSRFGMPQRCQGGCRMAWNGTHAMRNLIRTANRSGGCGPPPLFGKCLKMPGYYSAAIAI
ncbi:hypothetical protein TH9_03625 [Thalassospira xiamenensis]|nr:hypothetical protein TH9_03625 [Thalassospira xiamenensis]